MRLYECECVSLLSASRVSRLCHYHSRGACNCQPADYKLCGDVSGFDHHLPSSNGCESAAQMSFEYARIHLHSLVGSRYVVSKIYE